MKADTAKILVTRHIEISKTIDDELKYIYKKIEESAMEGLSAYHYHIGWLNSEIGNYVMITNKIVENLTELGYGVKLIDANPNKPYLIISWL